MNIIFLGPPGVGKGTIAKMVGAKYKIPHISTGDLFRQAIKNKSPLGLQVKEIIDRGNLVPDEVTVNLLKERLQEPDCQKGYILDGFPRTIEQAERLAEFAKIDHVVTFRANEEIVLKRLGGRLTCKECKHVFNIHTMPPKQENICDLCSGELYQREDQKPGAIKIRLKVYEEQTKPLEDYYKDVLKAVHAEKSPTEIFADVQNILE